MPSAQHALDSPTRVKEITKHHFLMVMHHFFDAWASILTPSEYLVFSCILRFASFGSQESDGYFTLARCSTMTGLNRKTVIRAVSSLRQHAIIIVVPRNGQSGLIKVNQDVTPKPEAARKAYNHAQHLRQPGPTAGTGPGPTAGTGPGPTAGTGPGPTAGTGPGPTAGTTPVPSVGQAIERHERQRDLHTLDDDDGGKEESLGELIDGFLEMGQSLDYKMASRYLSEGRKLRKDVKQAEILMICRQKLPAILRDKHVRQPLAYLLRSVLECLAGRDFDQVRQRYLAFVDEQVLKAKEVEEILEWGKLHGHLTD